MKGGFTISAAMLLLARDHRDLGPFFRGLGGRSQREPDPGAEGGREVPAGESPHLAAPVRDRVVLTRDPLIRADHAEQLPLGPAGAHPFERVLATEGCVPRDRPAEAGLEWVDLGRELVPVECETHLEPQGVASSESRPAARPPPSEP